MSRLKKTLNKRKLFKKSNHRNLRIVLVQDKTQDLMKTKFKNKNPNLNLLLKASSKILMTERVIKPK